MGRNSEGCSTRVLPEEGNQAAQVAPAERACGLDLDAEVERHFGPSIGRLQARCVSGYSCREECSVVLERIVADNPGRDHATRGD